MFRLILTLGLLVPVASLGLSARVVSAAPQYKSFVFKIKTKAGSIVSNISIHARDQYEAESKLKTKYKDCTVLRMEVKH